MEPFQKAGKSGPRFVEDLINYDPAHVSSNGPNLLSQVPPICRANPDGSYWAFTFDRDSCQHNYVVKSKQTKFSMEHGQGGRVSAVCSKCRCHMQVVMAYRSTWNEGSTTSSDADHLHHFVYTPSHDTLYQQSFQGQKKDRFSFRCSNDCEAIVSVHIQSPIISPRFEQMLTDPQLIRSRTEEAIKIYPARFEGVVPYSPITILDNLRRYLSNSIDGKGRPIAADNPRYLASFGLSTGPCRELLQFLGFSFSEVTINSSLSLDSDGTCHPPQPIQDAFIPYRDDQRIFLDNTIEELVCLINQRPASEQEILRDLPKMPSLARSDFFSVLEAYYDTVAYDKDRFVGMEPLLDSHFPPFQPLLLIPLSSYHNLGAVEDMTSSLIVKCFDLQMKTDPTNSKIYLQSLKQITDYRSTYQKDTATLAVAIENAYAQGKYTQRDLTDAAEFFGLHWHQGLNHRHIIDKFYGLGNTPIKSVDLSDERHEVAREKLRILGEELQSEEIKHIWGQSEIIDKTPQLSLIMLTIYKLDLSRLDHSYEYLGVNKLADDDFISAAYTAKIIDSPLEKVHADRALQDIADERNSFELKKTLAGDMTLAEAYQLFGLDPATTDDGDLLAVYTCCLADYPAQADAYARALEIIGRATNSASIREMLGIFDESPSTTLLPSSGPVGLYNIGNTCYLNSLLQFYFSIIPYRELVLNIDQYKMDVTDEQSLENKQVGSRKVTMKEVKRSLTFLSSLASLFRDMMNPSGKHYVVPTKELARLTLISPGNEAAIRRRSTISAVKPHGLGEVDGAVVLGPLGPPKIVEDNQEQPVDINSDAYVTLEVAAHPPPVPPRPSPQPEFHTDFKTIEEAEIETGAQQDVIEVINNVLFQSQCGIKPTAIDKDGEQVDMIKDLFYGQTRSYISTAKGVRSKEERWCDIKVDVVDGPRDIYAAIDGAFDAQKISVENSEAEQYASITSIPPILQIQVQRAQFDPVTKLAYKSTNHLQLHEVIYMDRYMDSPGAPELVDRRRQCWEWKNALASAEAHRKDLQKVAFIQSITQFKLKHQQSRDLPDEATRAILHELNDLDLDEDSLMEDAENEEPDSLNSEIEDIERIMACISTSKFQNNSHISFTDTLEALDSEIEDLKAKIGSQFDHPQFQNLAYSLYAVFIHRGTVDRGHYWLYMFDFRQNIWRKYNDEDVTEVKNTDEIFKPFNVIDPQTSYILVYLNDEKKHLLANPVCRQSEGEETEQNESRDSPMIDLSD
ncbi:Peptidase C19 ubiquitin carboxyl-terminal hydrolase 2 [Penicillium taxi]|uniref:Peptidase C19 ubiquitin carboxyl-terminal hydrolase 2 n=1 Tax=Penicillium taxi TaxID=168475 RepID=UPI00254587DE|nr:Peptidase C19 ubiquitin carboxyl-terminal hydrolase 2 [Penicillium taxi]KAJ5898876.1 Peptidase C19 ubiquitin carboxyl-terminal hydrolase 2 [Penicillium taxi]